MPEVELKPLATLGGGPGGGGGPVTAADITDATEQGKAVLTGDANAGLTALGAASQSALTALAGVVDALGGTVAGLPAPPTVDTLEGLTEIGKDLGRAASKASARTKIDAAGVDEVVALTGDQTIAGVKTHTDPVIVPTPSADGHAATKLYVDDAAAAAGLGGYLAGKLATGEDLVVKYTGSAWPALSTVDGDYLDDGGYIDWQSQRHLDAPQPPEMRDGDTWTHLVEG